MQSARSTPSAPSGSAPPPGGAARATLGYQPALDGLRAVSVLVVLLFHGDVSWLPGGFLGVEVFFVISGFLITTLLVEEFARRGTIDRAAFWRRRGRRLLPALFALIAAVVAYSVVFAPPDVARLRGDVV